MKRQIVYAGQVPLETDLLNSNKNIMVAIGHVLQDMIGTSTLFSGLGCVPTSPAGMTVNVNPGRAYSLQATDTGAYSSLSADARQVVKQGILLDAANFSCPAPTTAGFSVNYLIQGAFQEVDSGSLVLPYYNASNPSQAYNGPNGTGTSQTTARDNTVQLQVKAGVAATTGSQVTPTPDAGFTGLWVVTVAFGQSTITSTSIAQYPGAPFLPASLLAMIQQGSSNYSVATGTANAHVAAFQPPITARVDGMVLRYKAPAANTGALTFNDGLGAVAVVGAAHSALQGGETAPNGDVWLQWNSSIGGGSYVMLDSTGGALQVGGATQNQHAVQFGQVAAIAGTSRNLSAFLGAQGASASWTADEILIKSALGGVAYQVGNFNKTVNLGGSGAGGVVGTTPAVNGFAAIYAAIGSSGVTAFATDATAAKAPEVYGGALPAGYTSGSQLIAIAPVSGTAGQFAPFSQTDRKVDWGGVSVLTGSSAIVSATARSSTSIPLNARFVSGFNQVGSTVASAISQTLAPTTIAGAGGQFNTSNVAAGASQAIPYRVAVVTAQTIYQTSTNSAGTPSFTIAVNSYEF